jgi:protocatechuate 3,4-dioxygenase, beta subunit
MKRRTPQLKSQPPLLYPPYKSTVLRAPRHRSIQLPESYSDLTQPVYGSSAAAGERQRPDMSVPGGEPQGERIIVAGRVVDEDGRPSRNVLLELWQANAAGRYRHVATITRRRSIRISSARAGSMTDSDGRYQFTTIKPGAYPWRNHPTRGARRTSTSRSSGGIVPRASSPRCTFPATRCSRSTPCFSRFRPSARERLVSKFDLSASPSPSGRSAMYSTSCCAATTRRRGRSGRERHRRRRWSPARRRRSGRTCTSVSTPNRASA